MVPPSKHHRSLTGAKLLNYRAGNLSCPFLGFGTVKLDNVKFKDALKVDNLGKRLVTEDTHKERTSGVG